MQCLHRRVLSQHLQKLSLLMSCSLTIYEIADPRVRQDLAASRAGLVPPGDQRA